jgi:hypothetical protein
MNYFVFKNQERLHDENAGVTGLFPASTDIFCGGDGLPGCRHNRWGIAP